MISRAEKKNEEKEKENARTILNDVAGLLKGFPFFFLPLFFLLGFVFLFFFFPPLLRKALDK